MEFTRGLFNLPADHGGCALTIGNFDGLHRGHQALIAGARRRADQLRLPLLALCFEPTPREYFEPERAPPRIATLRTKLADFARYGVDRVVIQRFDMGFARQSPEEFIAEVLLRQLKVRALVVGEDFSFGRRREGKLQHLLAAGQQHGFAVEGVPSVLVSGERCSSTAVRAALAEPDLPRAAELLGRPYRLLGKVVRGLQLGRTLDMPTANLNLRRRPALRLGVYAVRARLDGETQARLGVASIGVRPTLGITRCLLETHLFDSPGDIYGRHLDVEFAHFLRPEERFESLDALKAQMHRDKADALAFLSAQPDNDGLSV